MPLYFSEQHIIDIFFTDELLFYFQYYYIPYQFEFKRIKGLLGLEIIYTMKNSKPFDDSVNTYKSNIVMFNRLTLCNKLSCLIIEDTRDQVLTKKHGEPKVYGNTTSRSSLILSTDSNFNSE